MHPSLKGASKIMSIARITNIFPRFALFVLICAVPIYSPRPAFAQTTDSSGEQAKRAQSVSDSSPASNQASEAQQQPSTHSATCGVEHLGHCLKDIGHDQAGIWTSPLRVSPRDAFWLVPFAAGTGVALHSDQEARRNLGFDKGRIETRNVVYGLNWP